MQIPTVTFYNTFILVFPASGGNGYNSTAKNFIQQCVGYAAKAVLRSWEDLTDEDFTWGFFGQHTWVEVKLDSTKASGYPDMDFFEAIQDYLHNGSPAYKRAYRGKPKGFQLITPMFYKVDIEYVITDHVNDNGTQKDETARSVELNTYIGRLRTLNTWEKAVDKVVEELLAEETQNSAKDVSVKIPEQYLPKTISIEVPEGAKSVTVTFNF